MGDVLKKVPVREQAPKVRATNFDEVCLGYNKEEAMEEASRCLTCKNAKCVQGCPVSINIPAFIKEVKEGNFAEAYKVIGQSSALPAVCGRVCPQETQCEGKCIRGIKGEAISIGKLERFVADWARQNQIKPQKSTEKKNKKVAVIGSGPSGLTCAGDLAKMGYDVTIFEALHEPGGVLVYGIPEFRLPKSTVVASEIGNLANNSSTTAETIKNICLNASGNIKDVSNCFNQIVDYLESNVTPKFAEFSEIARGNNTMSVELQEIISNIKIIVDEFVDFVKMVTTQMSQIGEAATQNEEGIDIIVEQNNQTSLIAEHISTAIEQNNESAEQLRNIIEKFHY